MNSTMQWQFIDCDSALASMLDILTKEPAIGVDTESDSMHYYQERVCLVQLSSCNADFIVDPLAVDITPLAQIFSSENIEKVFHAAEYDIMSLKRDFSFTFTNIFDTMIACRVLGVPKFGLGNLLSEYFGVTTNKRMQLADWRRRPLSEEQLQYAAADSHYLLALRDILADRLNKSRRMRLAQEHFSALCEVIPRHKEFHHDGYLKVHGAAGLEREELAVLHELYSWRESLAKQIDKPPFQIARDEVLIRLAMIQPKDRDGLRIALKRGDAAALNRHAETLLAAIRSGINMINTDWQPPSRPENHYNRQCEFLYQALRDWRTETGRQLAIEPAMLIGNACLRRIAETRPHSRQDLEALDCLMPIQLEEYGTELLRIVYSCNGGCK